MRQIQASEAKTRFLQLLDDVERGDTLVITRRGRAIARITPESAHRRAEIEKTMSEIRQLRPRFGRITVNDLISSRDEGRKR
jgi:prevent-host-death family protein